MNRKGGHTEYVGPERLAKEFRSKSAKFAKDVKADLEETFGFEISNNDPFLFKFDNAVSTLQEYAWGHAELPDADARIRGFTNLKLMLENADELHSWGSRTSKARATIAKIPKIVLMNASEDVTFKDYGRADHMRVESGKRRLLSFHRGFRATKSVFGKGKDSRAYRTNLRAITASALLLGGFDKALEVKELLTKINSLPTLEDGKSRENMVKSVLDRLETHGDLNALISDLSFELERHSIQAAYDARYNDDYANDSEEEFYADVAGKLQDLDSLPNRTVIIQNIVKNILNKEQGYTHGEEELPSNVMRDLLAATAKNPMDYLLKVEPNNADSGLSAITCWTNLMTPKGTQNDIRYELETISHESESSSRDIYQRAAQLFANVCRNRRISPEDQAALMVLCLRNPDARPKTIRTELKSIKAQNEQMRLNPAPGDDDVDDDIKYDNFDDIIDVTKNKEGKDKIKDSVFQNNNDDNTEETKEDIKQDELIKEPPNKTGKNNNEKNLESGGDDQRMVLEDTESQDTLTDIPANAHDSGGSRSAGNVDVRIPAQTMNQNVGGDADTDDDDPDGGDEAKLDEITDAERFETPGGAEPTNKPENTNQEN